MKKFKHASAESLEKAVSILESYGRKARVIAGGTDLLGEMQDAILPDYPEVIVDIKTIPGLDYVKEESDGLYIGALTRLEDIATNSLILEHYPLLAEASCRTASPHIREMGTVAGNICQSNRCWYYWVEDNRFGCLRKGGKTCFAVNGDARYHSIFGSTRVGRTPCSVECPAHIDIPDYMEKIREGNIEEAARILLESNPLPAVTGRVCPHYCEAGCNRAGYDDAVSIRCVERYLGDYALNNPEIYKKPIQKTGKKAAIIGSGPAGLAAAAYLNRLSHDVTIYEKMDKPGGLLTYGIPPYRLPKDIVEKQIEVIGKTGIKIELSAGDIDTRNLSTNYDAVLLACGAWRERESGIQGEELLLSGLEFLRDINTGKRETPGQNIAVLGGGNVAIDVARTLKRLGAEPVVLYRRTRDEMPALAEEIERADEEGIAFRYLTQPVAITKKNSSVNLTCVKMQLGEPDESGRPRPEPVSGSEFSLEFDAVIGALGETPDPSVIPDNYTDNYRGLDKETGAGILGDNVFAAGDFVSGPSSVIRAIAAGKRAAESIDEFLGGKREQPDATNDSKKPDAFNSEYLGKTERAAAHVVPIGQRNELDIEDTGGLESDTVVNEANRCFNCGCVAVNPSDLAPALIVLDAEIKTSKRIIKAGDFFAVAGEKTTVLDDDEIVTEIRFPRPGEGTKCKFLKSAIRKSIDFPLVNCAAAITCNDDIVTDARICLNSVYTMPYRVNGAEEYLKGKAINERTAEAAAETILAAALPLLNNRYKIQIARTLVKRVILACG